MNSYLFRIPILLALICITAALRPTFAQERKSDFIVKNDSSRIEVKILVIADQTVQYKKVSDPQGPIFHLLKSDISRILYGNGETETFPNHRHLPLHEKEGTIILYPTSPWLQKDFTHNLQIWRTQDLKSAYQFYRAKTKSTKIVGTVLSALGGGAVIAGIIVLNPRQESNPYGYSSYNEYQELGTFLVGSGLGLGVTAGIIGILRSKSYRRRADLVDKELKKRGDPFSFMKIRPAYNLFNHSGSLSLALKF